MEWLEAAPSPLGQIGDEDAIVVAVATEHDVLAVHAADECWDTFGSTGPSVLSCKFA